MERLFVRGKDHQRQPRDGQLHIGVTGLGQSTGATLIASSLAFFFWENGEDSTYIECVNPSVAKNLLFDTVAMEKRFVHREFYGFYRMIQQGEPVRGKHNMEMGVKWILATPEDREDHRVLTDLEKNRLMHCGRSDVIIFDFSCVDEWEKFFLDMDRIIVVVDPLPSKLIHNVKRFKWLKHLELAGLQVDWIVNRDNAGVNHRQVNGYLKTKDVLWLPELATEDIYADEYACRFHWENPEIRSKILDIFTKVSH